MRYKDPQSGKVFESITQALEAFKCPGPCDPDCPLYEAAKLSSGLWRINATMNGQRPIPCRPPT